MKKNVNLTSSSKDSSQIFDEYVRLAEEFCVHLQKSEGISCEALSSFQEETVRDKFFSLSPEAQTTKYENFKNYYNISMDFTREGFSLRSKKKFLLAFLHRNRLSITDSDDVFEFIDDSDEIEVYSFFRQKFRTVDFLDVTTHCLMALETFEWFDLFERSKIVSKKQMEIVQKLLNGVIQTPIYKPLDLHMVKEINSPKPLAYRCESIVYAPISFHNGGLYGGLHVFRLSDHRSLDFKIV